MSRSTLARRTMMAGTLAGGALSVLPARAQRAQPPAPPTDILTKRLPRGEETLPAIGLGTFLTFDAIPGQARAHLAR